MSMLLTASVIIPTTILVASLIPKFKDRDDISKIEEIFENMKLGIAPQVEEGEYDYPSFKRKEDIVDGGEVIGINYQYTVPLGFPATKVTESDTVKKCFADGLNKPVDIKFDYLFEGADVKFLQIKVFNKEIPKLFKYADVPYKKGWNIPIGKSLEGFVFHNFEHIPHLVVAGTTRFGKTVFLKNAMTFLIEHHSEDVEFYLIDLKGGLEFSKFENLKQVKGTATNMYEAHELLCDIHELVESEMRSFRKKGYNNISSSPIKKRRFIIVDEAAQLAVDKFHTNAEKKLLSESQYILSEVARIGGGIGFRLIFCTQYPTADTLPRQIKQNSDAKLSFRLGTGYASQVAIDEYGAEKLPSDIKGRALYKTHELTELQVPLINDKEMLDRLSKFMIKRTIKKEREVKVGDFIEATRTEVDNFVKFG